MKKLLVFILAFLSSTVMFAQTHYTVNTDGCGAFWTKLFCVLTIDGEEQYNTNLEIGVFDQDGFCRGAKKGIENPRTGRVIFQLQMKGVEGYTVFSFKVYDHDSEMELDLVEDFGEGVQFTYQGNYTYQWNGSNSGAMNPYELNFTHPAGEEPFLDITGYGESDGGYYLIASPVNSVTPTTENGFLTDVFDLYAFDQAAELEWLNYEANPFELVAGQGYLYASQSDTRLTFNGELYNGNGEVTLHSTEGGDFPGWNLVGNPFLNAAIISATDQETGDSFSPLHYTMNETGSEIMEGGEGEIEPMTAVFVVAQYDEEIITFTTEQSGKKAARLNLNLTRNNKVIDRAALRFGKGHQLPKFQLRENSTKVYIPMDGNNYAVVNATEMGEMPVSFKAESNGYYTLSVNAEEVSFGYLHLIDNMTGIDTDLLSTPSYSFEAKTTDYANRFKLVFATGNTDETFAFFSNGSFVINNEGIANVQVIDVTGRIVNSETINGCANVNVNAAPGVYMLRLVNGDNVKVQKVVVR